MHFLNGRFFPGFVTWLVEEFTPQFVLCPEKSAVDVVFVPCPLAKFPTLPYRYGLTLTVLPRLEGGS